METASQEPASVWYLGLDIGQTGISAVLLNRLQGRLYPVYWSKEVWNRDSAEATQEGSGDRRFRLPLVVTLQQDGENPAVPASPLNPQPNRCLSVPVTAVPPYFVQPAFATLPADAPEFYLQGFKPLLKTGIPYSPAPATWQPVVQWSDLWQVPLLWLRQALQHLLATLNPAESSLLGCGALGLDPTDLGTALKQLAGVIVSYPTNWSDTYSFNLREAILAAGLVQQPQQIFFVEEIIATLLSVLPQATPAQEPETQQGRSTTPTAPEDLLLHNADWQGNTLVLNGGATVTELALVNLPLDLSTLSHADFHRRSLPYAGSSIDQDIIGQLLYPLLRQPIPADVHLRRDEPADISLEPVHLERLALDMLTLPTAGEPDLLHRYQLQQRLESSRSGQILLDAACCLKVSLQQQSRFTLRLGDRQWTILRQDLGSKVLLPYVQKLNRELNLLLKQTQTPAAAVNQVLCTGGTASMAAIARWLRQKFPNATIIQDTYARSIAPQEHCITSCSRVAYGLAVLPLYPQVLNQSRQQYNDYFLLMAILRHLPDRPLTIAEVMQILEQQGMEIAGCRSHILAILEGHLPPGLVPAELDAVLMVSDSLGAEQVATIQAAPLFQKQDELYIPNSVQRQRLQDYLDRILHHSQQTLTHPHTLMFLPTL